MHLNVIFGIWAVGYPINRNPSQAQAKFHLRVATSFQILLAPLGLLECSPEMVHT